MLIFVHNFLFRSMSQQILVTHKTHMINSCMCESQSQTATVVGARERLKRMTIRVSGSDPAISVYWLCSLMYRCESLTIACLDCYLVSYLIKTITPVLKMPSTVHSVLYTNLYNSLYTLADIPSDLRANNWLVTQLKYNNTVIPLGFLEKKRIYNSPSAHCITQFISLG